jgi:DNA-binding MarR family transcriptional regulator
MVSNKEKSLSYVRFLNLVEATRQLPGFPAIDVVEDQILAFFARSWYVGQRVTVVEAMNSLPELSPSTVQRRLKSLRSKKLLATESDEQDSRYKYIVPTELAVQYFAALGQCVEDAKG